jgi:hypothetical protein
MALGPSATWDLIHKSSASIPCQRKVKDHVKADVNHFLRGKYHRSPEAEEDIQNLQKAYHKDGIHTLKPGRRLTVKDRVKDYMALGTEDVKLKGVIQRWISGRTKRVKTSEDFATYDSD